jgi:hypothetical protein
MYNKMDGYHFGIKLTIFSPYDPITKEKKERHFYLQYGDKLKKVCNYVVKNETLLDLNLKTLERAEPVISTLDEKCQLRLNITEPKDPRALYFEHHTKDNFDIPTLQRIALVLKDEVEQLLMYGIDVEVFCDMYDLNDR